MSDCYYFIISILSNCYLGLTVPLPPEGSGGTLFQKADAHKAPLPTFVLHLFLIHYCQDNVNIWFHLEYPSPFIRPACTSYPSTLLVNHNVGLPLDVPDIWATKSID